MTSTRSGPAPDEGQAPTTPTGASAGRLRLVLSGLVLAAALGAAVWVLTLDGPSPRTSQAQRDQAAVSGNYAGLQETPAPWQPEYRFLIDRLTTLGFPPVGDESFHIHTLLTVYVDGQQVPVPENVGISFGPTGGIEAHVHTHDPSGIVHVESDEQVLLTTGAGAFAVVPLLLCGAMMGGMMRSSGGSGRGDR